MSNGFVHTKHFETTIVSTLRDTNGDILIVCNPKFNGCNLLLSRENNNFDELNSKLIKGKTYDFICVDESYNPFYNPLQGWLKPDPYSIFDFLESIFCGDSDSIEIMDIMKCKVHSVCGIVTGVKDIEYPQLQDFQEIIIYPNKNNMRIILEKKYIPKDIIGKKYNIDCVKTLGYNFYTLY
jgi:hypothetical protein